MEFIDENGGARACACASTPGDEEPGQEVTTARTGQSPRPPEGLVLDGREQHGMLMCVGTGREVMLEVDRGEIAHARITAAWIVEVPSAPIGLALEPPPVEKLTLQRGEEAAHMALW